MDFISLEPIDQIQFEPDETRQMPKFTNIDYLIENIVQKFEDMNNISDDELKSIIKRQYKLILNYDNFLSNNREFAQRLFMNKRFLNCLLDIIGTLILDRDEKICINKLCYDYLRLPNKDQEILDILLSISYYVNNILVIRLSAYIPIREARMLAIIANSSFKIEKNIHRINWFFTWVCTVESGTFMNVYQTLFDHLMYPIIYTLLQVDTEALKNQQTRINYNMITASMITLLLHMTMDDMVKVLTNYGYIWILYGKPPVRVEFRKLPDSEKFSRLRSAILQIDLGPYDDIEIL